MLEQLHPYILLSSWLVLGLSVGFVAIHSVFGVMKGVRTVWPIAFLFTLTGWLAAELPGMLVGLCAAAVIGLFVGRA